MRYIPKKYLGQHFLTSTMALEQITNLLTHYRNDSTVVEIGPGLGALTTTLLSLVDHLQVIEIDRDLIQHLNNKFGRKVTIHNIDALKFDYHTLANKIHVVGNLPYNISTPLLFYLAKFTNIVDMYFMLQQEVVDRICATPDNKDYGKLSVMLQYRFTCTKLLTIERHSFSPPPKVTSAIVCLKPKLNITNINEQKLNIIVTNAFSKRRKMISNSLANIVSPEYLDEVGATKRAENLTIDEYIYLSQTL
jgi:16S rRNA (adenine1518-N6/adenine1519-N6)-dimethyltransferase